MKDINSFLKLFTIEESYHPDWCKQPFRIEDKVYATDMHVMLIIPAKLAPGIEQLETYDQKSVLSVIPTTTHPIMSVSVKDLFAALKVFPTVKANKDCEACKGEGEVQFEYYWEGRRYTNDDDCPVCDGEGAFPDESGAVVPDPDKSITIGKANFAGKYIKKLYELCKFFDLQAIDLVSQSSPESLSLFSKDGVSILIMPVKDVESVYSIKN